ncbi:MAG: META domain-containing protein, partial [Muribaculaceae bacterium]|nr:META domain-containing protein [Muribaculaceae bacterium]
DMETANTLSFQDIVTTRMACPDPSLQTRLIVALEDAAHARPVDANQVVLLNLLRKPVLTLRRL